MATGGKRLGLGKIRTNTIVLVTLGWSLAVFAVLVWQAILYRGLVAQIGEWQFLQFNRYFPVATIAVMFIVLTFPLYFVLLRRTRRRTRIEQRVSPGSHLLIERARFWRTSLTVTTAILLAIALSVIAHAFTIGGVTDKQIDVVIGAPGSDEPGEGMRRLRGTILTDRIAVYSENYVLARREFAVAPVVATGSNGKRFTFFAQLDSPKAALPSAFSGSGFLHRERLAGALRALYQQAGYDVAQPAWVLYRSVAAARWTHLRIAGIIAIMAIIVGLLTVKQMRRLQKLRRLAK